MSTWICREKTFWRDVTWEAGDELRVGDYEDRKWKLGGGWWAPVGLDVIDIKANLTIPWYFEPTDMSILVNPQEVYLARDHKKNDRDWKFTFEIESKDVPAEELPLPVPLTPDTIKQLKEDPDLLVTDKTKQERLKRTPRKPLNVPRSGA
jgi:hypothetical protein